MSRAGIERKLRSVSSEMRKATDELRVLDEQLAHFADSADDARLRSMVSETPLAAQEYREAAKTVAALRRDRDHWTQRLDELETRQNELLDQLLEASS
ncbi:MAG: hypothetical protein ACRBI6_17255 [Acidimicrobiales bacterium]